MNSLKEKRILERIPTPNLFGALEISENKRQVSIVNVCEDGACISGADIAVGDVVRLYVDQPEQPSDIALYAKVVWAEENDGRVAGLNFLHTNKILFKQELTSFTNIVDSARIKQRQV